MLRIVQVTSLAVITFVSPIALRQKNLNLYFIYFTSKAELVPLYSFPAQRWDGRINVCVCIYLNFTNMKEAQKQAFFIWLLYLISKVLFLSLWRTAKPSSLSPKLLFTWQKYEFVLLRSLQHKHKWLVFSFFFLFSLLIDFDTRQNLDVYKNSSSSEM